MSGETNETSQTAFPTGAGSGARPSESHVRYEAGQGTGMLREVIPVFSDTCYSVKVLEWLRKQESIYK